MLNSQRILRCALLNNSIKSYATKAKSTKKDNIDTEKFPKKLLNKKHKTPANIYIAHEEIAKLINQYSTPYIQNSTCDTAIEMNPGLGFLTEQLLQHKKLRKIIAIEAIDHFMPNLQSLQNDNSERLLIRHGDLISAWKLAFQDKMDNGNRIDGLLKDIPRHKYDEDPNVLLFGAVGCYKFFQHLINAVVFQIGLLTLGRCEMYLAMPPPIYVHLTCSNEIGYLIYRSSTMLFQILFEHRFIAKLPREHFMPKETEFNLDKNSKLKKIKSIDPDFLYLVRIVPRKDLHKYCPVEDLPALWYFIKQNCISRRNRVIPHLEKFVPGCGLRLIINRKEQKPIQQLYADENLEDLPKYSIPCTNMHCNDFVPNMNIFTQFGDLRPSQMLTLFREFRSWPEYKDSSFLASFENSLLKLQTTTSDNLETMELAEDDDVTEPDADVAEEKSNQTETNMNKNK